MAYYYLVAALPSLRINEAVPFTPDAFYTSCKDLLSPADAADMHRLLTGHPEDCLNPLVRSWWSREVQLRNALVRIRSSRLKTDAESFLRETASFDTMIESGAARIMAMDNPLERELALDRLRWRILDDLVLHDMFGAFALHAFMIKLQSAYRWAGLTDEKGIDRIDEIIHKNLQRGIV